MSLTLLGCRLQGSTVSGEQVSPPVAAVTEPAAAPEVASASPAGDLDADGVPDASDRCPDEPEDVDGFEDEDGCVDRDNDRDGVLDAFEFQNGRWTNCDRKIENGVEIDCRNRPEDYDGDADEDGCPDYLCMDQCQRWLGDRVHFDRAGRLDADAAKVLDAVAEFLRSAPDLHVWVDAHVDPRRDRQAARRASEDVARRVIEEMVRRGVARERMEALGWGDEKPLDRKTTAEARSLNRRVQFELKLDSCCRPLQQSPPKTIETPAGSRCI